MSKSKWDFGKNSLVVVTGASRGIGRCLAIECGKRLKRSNQSCLVLIARSEANLKQVENTIIENGGNGIQIELIANDLAQPDGDKFAAILQEQCSNANVRNAIIFHNAGTTGRLTDTMNLDQMSDWREFLDLNVSSAAVLNAIFLKSTTVNRSHIEYVTVVNISSLCGRQPFRTLGQYGTAKAARELFFKVVAAECSDRVRVLNYSPGPVDTDMYHNVMENSENETIRQQFRAAQSTAVLQPSQTVDKLLDLLVTGDFQSGDTIDYYDNV